MTSRYLRKHYKKEDILSYSRLIKGFYRFLFEEFSPRKILREILLNAKDAGTFQITRQKKRKSIYFVLSCLFHLLCFLFTDYYQRHYTPPPLVIAKTSFDQSAIQLVSISSALHKNIKTSGGKPQDPPRQKSTQGIPEKMVRMARAEKPVLAPPAPEKFLNKIFRRAIKVKRSSRTQKVPNTQSKKMELSRLERPRDLPPIMRDIKTKKPAPRRLPTIKPVRQPPPAKPLPTIRKPTTQRLVKNKVPQAMPKETKPVKPAVSLQRQMVKAIAPAKTKEKIITPAPGKIESVKAAPKAPKMRKKLAYEPKEKKIAKRRVKQPHPVKPAPAPQKPTAEQVVKKVALISKPSVRKPAKPTIPPKRNIAKAMAKAKTKITTKSPTPPKIESTKAAPKVIQERKKLAYKPKAKKIARQKIEQPHPVKPTPAPQKPTTEQVVKKVAIISKPSVVKPAKPTITQKRNIEKSMAKAKTKAKTKTEAPRKIELVKTAAKPKVPEGRRLAYEPEAKKSIKQPAKPHGTVHKVARQETKELTLTAPKARKAKAGLPELQIARRPVAPPPPTPSQQRKKPVAEAVVTSPKGPLKKREVSLKKQGKTIKTATKRLEYEGTMKTRKAENLPQTPPVKTSPIKPRAVPIAELVQKAVTHTPKKTAINTPTISPKQVQKVVPSSSIILAKQGDKTFTIEFTEKPKTVNKLRHDFQGQKALSAPSAKQPHVPKKPEDIEQLLKLSPNLALVSSATRKKITVTHKSSVSEKAEEFLMEKGPRKEWKKEVQYTRTQAPKTKGLQKELSYEKSNSPRINPTSKRVPTADSKTSIASRSVQGPEYISQKTSTLLDPAIARDMVAKTARKITPHKRDVGFPLRENNFSLPVQLTPEPGKAVQLAKRSTSNPAKALEGKDLEYSKITLPIKVKHQLRLQYKTESTLHAGREITGPEMVAKNSALTKTESKKDLPSLQQATKTEPAIQKNDIVSLNREESRHLISPSYEQKDKILRDAPETNRSRPEAIQVTLMAITSPKNTERPVKLRTDKIRYELEQQKNIRRFEGNAGETSLFLTGQQVAAFDVATKKIIQPTTIRNIRQPFMPRQTEDLPLPRNEKKITPSQQVTKNAEIQDKSLDYSRYRPTTTPIEQEKQTAHKSSIAKTAQIIQQLKQAIFDISAPEEEGVATTTRTATPRAAVEKIRGKLSNLIIKHVTPAEREFVEADQGKIRDITEQKILDFKQKGLESVEVEQERLVYPKVIAQVAMRVPEGPVTSHLEGPSIKKRSETRTDAVVEKKITTLSHLPDLPITKIEGQEITPEQEIARDLQIARIAADVIREMMGEKDLEYATAETTSERVEQQRVKFDEYAAEIAERAGAGPEISDLEGPSIEKRSESITGAVVEKKITTLSAPTDLPSTKIEGQEITPDQEIARAFQVAQMAADVIREMMGEKDLEYATAETTSERVEQQRVKFVKSAAEVAERAGVGPEISDLEGPSIEKRSASITGAVVEKKITTLSAPADLPSTKIEGRKITPEQEIARELLMARLTAQVVRETIEKEALEYTAAKTIEGVEQEKIQYSYQPAAKNNIQMDIPESAVEAAAGPSVDTAPREQTILSPAQRTGEHLVAQAQRIGQQQDVDWTDMTRTATLYIEKTLDKGVVKEVGAATLRDVHTDKELGYQAKIIAPTGISQERVRYEPESAGPQERLGKGPEQIEAADEMKQTKGIEAYDKVERIHTAKLREEKIPVMASDFHRYSAAVPLTETDKESPDALLGNSEVKTHAIEKEFQYEQRKETHDKVLTEQKRVRYQNRSNRLENRSTTGPESIVSQAEQFRELSGEAESRSTSNLDNIAKKTFSYKDQIDFPVIRSTEFAKVEAQKDLNRKKALDNTLSSLTAKSDKSLPGKQIAMVDRKKIDASVTSGIKQGRQSVKFMDSLASRPKMEKKKDLFMTIERPFSNMTRQSLYTLRGTIDKGVKLIFVTTNDITQMVPVVNGKFSAKLSMTKGINDIDILGYNSSGGIGRISSKILFQPRMAVPVVQLLSPQNGQQGMREGDAVLIKGTISDPKITKAVLYLNNIPIKIGVKNGVFKRKIFMPRGRVITFRIMATNKEGGTGYSPMHTILAGYEIDIINPRPY